MRKVYSFLALAIISLVGAFNASAQYYEAVGFDDLAYLEVITPGQPVVLQTASTGVRDFFCVNKKASIATEDCIFTFVEGTEVNGVKTYYLKQVSSGKYLSASGMELVSSRALAFNFYAKNPTEFYMRAEDTVPLDCDPTVIATYDQDHYGGVPPEGAFVLTNVKKATSDGWSPSSEETQKGGREDEAPWSYLAANWQGGAPFFGPWSDTNTWYLFEVAEKTGKDLLAAVVEDLGLESSDYNTMFTAGTSVGQVPQEYVDAWIQAAETATELLNSMSEDEDACQQAAEALMAAYKACKENVIKMEGGGWFRMRIHPVDGNASYAEGAYAFGADAKAQWVNGTYEVPEKPSTVEDAQFIWYLEADPEVEDGYKIRNFAENKYLGYVAKLSNVIPLVNEADQTYVVQPHANVDGSFAIIPTQSTSWGLHGQVNGHSVVFWYASEPASAWVFEGVAQDVIDELTPIVEEYWAELAKQAKLAELQALVDQSELAYNRGFAYKPDCTMDGQYYDEEPGLVTDVEQLWTNAQEADEGPIEGAIDGDFSTYWHTAWKAASTALVPEGEFHNLCADLGEAVDGVAVKITKRWSNPNGTPKKVRAFAANTYSEWEEEGEKVRRYDWEEQGVFEFEYPYETTNAEGETKANYTGINSIPFKKNYRYMRLDFETRTNDTNGSYNLSEIRFYKTVLDEDLSRIKGVPQEVVDELLKQVGVAKNEILDGEPTDATMEALQAAYDNFIDNYPDPQKLLDLIDEAKAQHDAAEEDNDLGYYQSGAKDALYAVIESVENSIKDKDVLSNEEIRNGETAIEAAIAEFDTKLNKPLDGVYYRIRNAATTETKAQGCYLSSGGNGNSLVVWGNNDENLSLKLEYVWKCVRNQDGTFAFVNSLSGNYLGTNFKLGSNPIYMSDTATVIRIETAKVPGKFVLRQGDSDAYANTSPQGYLVTYYGDDENSFFNFIPEANEPWQSEEFITLSDNYVHGLTLPFEVVGATGSIYKVLGVKDNLTLELSADVTSADAGEPFFVSDDAEEGSISLYPLAEKLADMTYTFEPKTVNGLVGTLAPVDVEEGGLLSRVYQNVVIKIYDTYSVSSNDVYLDMALVPVTEVAGDLSLPLDDDVINGLVGINDVVSSQKAQNVIFDLSGRRGLVAKKGLYIINGKKVLVK